jgi:ATP-dependent helicase HrpA
MEGTSQSEPADVLGRVFDGNAELLLVDRVRLQRRAREIQQRLRQHQPADRMLQQWEADLVRATKRWERRTAFRPKISFPNDLPITACRDQILEALEKHPVIIVSGDTGSGKTTQLPKMALAAGRGRLGRIGCTQPRRLAAVSMARRVAEELQCNLGQQVGYQVRFDDRTRDETIIKFMTDGILLAETTADRSLLQYDTLIVDEAHERNLNIDFILGYLKNLLPKRPDLKVLVSSATLDVESFARFFENAPVLTIEGRTYPIEDVFLPSPDPDADVARQVAHAVQWVHELDPNGDMLVFLPGEREIRDAAEVLRDQPYTNTEILPLFARLTLAEQQRVFTVGGRRRIVLATNVAETSITIPGIHTVIDSGLVRINRYQPCRQVQSLQIEPVSQASARQRRGRCGRVAEGLCVHLYSEEDLQQSPLFTDPEIRRASLAGVILQMAVLRLPPIDTFPFVNPPQRVLVAEGYEMLFEIGALDEKKNLTELGRDLVAFPVDPQIARMIVRSGEENVVSELLVLAALLSIQDPRERPAERESAADAAHKQWQDERSDFHSALRLWNAWLAQRRKTSSNTRLRRWCKNNFVSHRRMVEWQNLFRELADVVVDDLRWKVRLSEAVHDDCFYDRILRSVLAGIPMHVGRRGEGAEYQGTRDRLFYIFPGSGLFKATPRWVVAFSLVETLKLYGRSVAAIEPEWLEKVAPHLCRSSYSDIAWDAEQGFVYARESVTCGGLTILTGRKVHYGRIRPDVAREAFIREGMVPGNLRSRGAWLKPHRQMLQTIRNLEQKVRRPESLLDPQALFEHFNRLVPADICGTKDLDRWLQRDRPEIGMTLEDAMYPQAEPLKASDYPDRLMFRGYSFEVRYRFAPGEPEDGIVLRCPQQLLAVLPAWGTDWLVPGWLPEKIRSLMRALRKDLRAVCNPLQQIVDDFVTGLAEGRIARIEPLTNALAKYLAERLQVEVRPADFDLARLPEHLLMKIAVVDDQGKVTRFLSEKPSDVAEAVEIDRSSTWMPAGMYRTGMAVWDSGPLPERILLERSGPRETDGYPALVDEGKTVGVRLFLDAPLAAERHVGGLLRLFRIQHADLVESLERRLPLPTTLQAWLGALGGENQNSLEDFMDLLIEGSLRDDVAGYPRDPAVFARRVEAARTALYATAEERGRTLGSLMDGRQTVMKRVGELRNKGLTESGMLIDVDNQLAFLFRPGFLRGEDIWRRYPRYLQALTLRLERLKLNPAKDRSKWEVVRPFQELLDFRLAGSTGKRLPASLLRFSALLQEFRISQFAPELGTIEKVSPKVLEAAWSRVAETDSSS